jgi:hypothetical protein
VSIGAELIGVLFSVFCDIGVHQFGVIGRIHDIFYTPNGDWQFTLAKKLDDP